MTIEELLKQVEDEYNRLSAQHTALVNNIRQVERRIVQLEGKIEAIKELNTAPDCISNETITDTEGNVIAQSKELDTTGDIDDQ